MLLQILSLIFHYKMVVPIHFQRMLIVNGSTEYLNLLKHLKKMGAESLL